MATMSDLISEYREIVIQESKLSQRKKELRDAILAELGSMRRQVFQSQFGTAISSTRFTLRPKRDAVLGLLKAEDLLPFASFTPRQVKLRLVPKYGREALLQLFDIERKPCLQVKAPIDPDQLEGATFEGAAEVPMPDNDQGG